MDPRQQQTGPAPPQPPLVPPHHGGCEAHVPPPPAGCPAEPAPLIPQMHPSHLDAPTKHAVSARARQWCMRVFGRCVEAGRKGAARVRGIAASRQDRVWKRSGTRITTAQRPPHDVPSQYQPQPPVPHDQVVLCIPPVPSVQYIPFVPPSMPPQGPAQGAEGGAVPQTMRNTRQQLDAVIHTARRMKVWVSAREDALLQSTITSRLAAAVEIVTETAQMLEQEMRALGLEPAVSALAPQLLLPLPPDVGMSIQARSVLLGLLCACQSIVFQMSPRGVKLVKL